MLRTLVDVRNVKRWYWRWVQVCADDGTHKTRNMITLLSDLFIYHPRKAIETWKKKGREMPCPKYFQFFPSKIFSCMLKRWKIQTDKFRSFCVHDHFKCYGISVAMQKRKKGCIRTFLLKNYNGIKSSLFLLIHSAKGHSFCILRQRRRIFLITLMAFDMAFYDDTDILNGLFLQMDMAIHFISVIYSSFFISFLFFYVSFYYSPNIQFHE